MQRDVFPALNLWDWEDATPDPTLVIADGPSVRISAIGGNRDRLTGQVNGASLVIKDGPKGERVRTFHKVDCPMRRLIILGRHGFISLEAKRWLSDAKVSWMHIESKGSELRIHGMSGFHPNVKIRRNQAMCAQGLPLEATGVLIIKRYILQKVEGQAWNASALLGNEQAANHIRSYLPKIEKATSLQTIRGLEGNAAECFWSALKGHPVRWKGLKPLNPLWQAFPGRKTHLHGWETNKDATDPINAALNYAYHIGEALCILGCYEAGIDPYMGISHVDKEGRASFALDLIEAIRPYIDEVVLKIFSASRDKHEFKVVKRNGKDGIVTVLPPLTQRIASDVNELVSKLQPAIKFTLAALEG